MSRLCKDKNIIHFIVDCDTPDKTTSDILQFLISNTEFVDKENLMSLWQGKT